MNASRTSHIGCGFLGFLSKRKLVSATSIKRSTYAMGIKPCGGCEKRAAALNRWMRFAR